MLAFLAQLIPFGYRGHDLNSLTSSKLSSILRQIEFLYGSDFLLLFSFDFCRLLREVKKELDINFLANYFEVLLSL